MGCDLLQQWKIQVNISPISEVNYKIRNASERNTKRYQEQLQTVQVVHKQGTTSGGLSMVPTVLPLKWLTEKQYVWNNDL